MHVQQQFNAVQLVLVTIVAVCDDAHITGIASLCLNTLHYLCILIECYIGHHDAYGMGRIVTQYSSKGVGPVASLLCQTLYTSLQLHAHAAESPQGSRHRAHVDTQLSSYITLRYSSHNYLILCKIIFFSEKRTQQVKKMLRNALRNI